MLSTSPTCISSEIAEEFCEAQEPIRKKLQAHVWRSHGNAVGTPADAMSDEELLASAWSELPNERRWSPVRGEAGRRTYGPQSSIDESVVRSLTEQRLTQREIAGEIGMSQSAVQHFMQKRGIEPRRKGVPTDTLTPSRLEPLRLNEAEMIAQYLAKWSLRQVGLEHGCSDGTVRAVLLRNGVECRDLSEAQRGTGAFGRVRVRLDDEKVTELRMLRMTTGESWESLGGRYGVTWTVARAAGLGITWKHVPMPVVVEPTKRRKRCKSGPDPDRAVELYLTNLSTREVGRILGCTNKTVLRILKDREVTRRPARRLKGSGLADVLELKNAREILDMSAAGASKRSIAATLNVSFRTVQRTLERAGVCSNGNAASKGSAA